MATQSTLEAQLYERAVEHVKKTGEASVLNVQAGARISYNGALSFLERMEAEGVVSAADDEGKRTVVTP
jgi:S-DNA-T family DNA segregation ATPase FtsK/SpoIIIE